ncbi:MAG: DDE-type integrase/transposase/recombinase, partial [Egibacteraceae bacterium]
LGLGLAVNHKRVARLMRKAGLQGLYRRRARRDPTGPATEDDLAHRQFTVDAPDRLWLTDITEHPTNEGKLHCTAVMDAYSRRIIGWSIAAPMRTELVLDALGMAILRRGKELITKPGRSHRYQVPALAARTITALLALRDHGIAPILAGVRSPRMGRKPTHWTRIDRDYETLRINMHTLFHDLGITTTGAAAA